MQACRHVEDLSRTAHGLTAGDRRIAGAVRGPVVLSFVESLSTVFLTAVPVVLVAFVLTWFLKEIEVRDHTGAGAPPAAPRATM